MRFPRFFRTDPLDRAAQDLYAAAVNQARAPAFYGVGQVPDTLDGRFDMVCLHVFMIMQRITGAGEEGRQLAQRLYDVMFADMDQNLREMGVGDVGVGKRVKKMSDAYFGRVTAYHEALQSPGDEALSAALRRNLYGTASPDPEAVDGVARYIRSAAAKLAAQPLDDALAGKVEFPEPFKG